MKSKKNFEKDRFSFPGGDLEITVLGHGTLMLDYTGTIVHADTVKLKELMEKVPDVEVRIRDLA